MKVIQSREYLETIERIAKARGRDPAKAVSNVQDVLKKYPLSLQCLTITDLEALPKLSPAVADHLRHCEACHAIARTVSGFSEAHIVGVSYRPKKLSDVFALIKKFIQAIRRRWHQS